jgi:cell division protein FtsN
MSEFDRGAYTPQTDSPLSFDARTTRRAGGRPLPMALLVSCLILAVLVVAIVLFYRSGVRSAGQAPQPVGAPVSSLKAPPSAADQPVDAAAGLQVYKAEAPEPVETPPTFTPGPEQPGARPVVTAAAPAPLPPAPMQTASVAASTAQPVTPLPVKPLPVKPLPVTPLAQTPPAAQPKPAPAPAKAAVAKVPLPSPKPVAAPVEAAKGKVSIQIGAFSSSALADKGWSDIAKAFPGPMSGKTKLVVPLQKDSGTLYRTAIGGFASKADADAFCASLKAAGKTCFVKAN